MCNLPFTIYYLLFTIYHLPLKALNEIRKIYFVGIGGIGMSALARYFLGRGVEVFGYDRTETELTKTLASEGMQVHYEDDANYIPRDIDLAVFTPAIPKDHAELNWLFAHNYEVLKRSQVLGIISRGMRTIAISGTHGKTTTSALTAHLLRTGGVDCTAFLGGISVDLGSNFAQGKSDWAVIEADEYDRSFLQLRPDIAAIMSVDPDHLDIYGDEKEFIQNFSIFIRKIKLGGVYFQKADLQLPELSPVWFEEKRPEDWNLGTIERHTFGIGEGEFNAKNIRVADGRYVFDLSADGVEIKDIRMATPGRHNIENALAASAAVLRAGVGVDAIKKGLESFRGIKRRFEFIINKKNLVYIDDYAHHPTELKSAIEAARGLFPGKKLTVIFQPHLFSRTRDFQEGFAEALDRADEVLLLDIYPAREKPMEGITSKLIFDKMKSSRKELIAKPDVLKALSDKKIEVLMTMGAGDIDTLVGQIKKMFSGKV